MKFSLIFHPPSEWAKPRILIYLLFLPQPLSLYSLRAVCWPCLIPVLLLSSFLGSQLSILWAIPIPPTTLFQPPLLFSSNADSQYCLSCRPGFGDLTSPPGRNDKDRHNNTFSSREHSPFQFLLGGDSRMLWLRNHQWEEESPVFLFLPARKSLFGEIRIWLYVDRVCCMSFPSFIGDSKTRFPHRIS